MWSEPEDDLFDDFADTDPGAAGDCRQENGVHAGSQRFFGGQSQRAAALSSDTQRRDRIVVDYNCDNGESMEPSNEFEKMLLREGIEVRRDENCKKYIYIGDTTSDLLATKLEANMRVRRYQDDLLSAFEDALKLQENLIIYLEPSHSSCGVQESIFRVLILCRSSQSKSFDLLIAQLQDLQKSTQKALGLAHLCLAQIRFINRIYHSNALFCSIFEREIEQWTPEIRNALISSIPEVLTDVSVQQEAVRELQSLLLRNVKVDPVGCKLAVISALSLLNSDAETSSKLQARVVASFSEFDAELLPPLIELLLRRLDASNKGAFANLMTQLSTHLHVDQLSIKRRGKLRITVDNMVGEIFDKIAQYVVLGGECRWKEVQRFYRGGGTSEKGHQRNAGSQDSVLDSNAVSSKDNIESMGLVFEKALNFKLLCGNNVASLVSIAQQCLWSAETDTQEFGAKLFREMFLALPKHREVVLRTMLSHIVQTDSESEAILRDFYILTDVSSEELEPFVTQISEYFFILDRISIENIKRFFRAIFRLYANRPSTLDEQDNLNILIPLFLHSADNVQPIFGALGALMKLEASLLLEDSSGREKDIMCALKLLDEARRLSSYIRTFSYNELSEVLRMCSGCSKSPAMSEWLTVFIEEFQSDFSTDSYVPSRELEGERYTNETTKLWLKCSDHQNLGEAVPLLEAVMEAIRLQEVCKDPSSFEASQRDRWARIFYALNANVSMQGLDGDLKQSCDTLFRTVQWLRTLFNIFAEENACPGVDSEVIDNLWTKKFLLMFECQKELCGKLKSLEQWQVPDRTPLSQVTVVATEVKRKPAKKITKRKRKATTEETEVLEETLPPAQAVTSSERDVKRCSGKTVSIAKLPTCMKTMKLSAVVKLLKLMEGRRRPTIFLLEHLRGVLLQICPRVGKKSLPWAKDQPSLASIHGDSAVISSEIEKLLPLLWSTFAKTISFFRDQLNSSDVVTTEADVTEQLADLLRLCLTTLEHLFSWSHVTTLPSDSDAVVTRKRSRRDKMMTAIEHCILQEHCERSAGSEAESSVYGYLVDNCDVMPNVGAAIALLDCIAVFRPPSEELSNKMARNTLSFLKKEWLDKEGKAIKGASLTSAVRKMLSHYLQLRPVNYRLCAIQWILAKKLADLIPHEERRKSKVYEQNSNDPDLGERESKQNFACFTKGTFGTIYKVLFVAMNDALAAEITPVGSAMNKRVVQECLHRWSIAAGCVALFGLMLRVRELRSTSLLVVAIKEGRRFLATMCNKNGSFMYLLDDKSRLASVTDNVVEIIKSVQIGNRNFQNICVHAKANRSNILLKLVPDFRVTNEQWMRAIQAKFVGINCLDAFEIGLLKPRDINGEEIVYSGDESCSTCSDTEPEQQAEEGQSNSDDGNTSEVY